MPIKPALQAQFEQQFKAQTPIQAAVWEKLAQGERIKESTSKMHHLA